MADRIVRWFETAGPDQVTVAIAAVAAAMALICVGAQLAKLGL